jgi:hypothetical protein
MQDHYWKEPVATTRSQSIKASLRRQVPSRPPRRNRP